MLSRLKTRTPRPDSDANRFHSLSTWMRIGPQRSTLSFPALNHQMRGASSENKVQRNVTQDDLFSYKGQRWLWNEKDQLQRRYLNFDLEELVSVAENAAGAGANCVEISKLPEGNFNKTFLVKLADERQIIARLPNPNAGPSHYTTASEVATMDYVRNRLNIPVPKVITYDTQASKNGVGAEYIIMEKCPGIELGRVWDDLSGKERADVVRQLASFTARLSKARFPAYGSLYYSKDVTAVTSKTVDDTFSVGPTIGRSWFDDKRAEVNVSRGPWQSAEEVVNAILDREVACLTRFAEFPRDRQQGIFNGPGGYRPTKASKLAVIEDVRRVIPHIILQDEAHTSSVLWHNDLHSDNIFVNRDQPTQITGIIDWQGVHLSPAFLHVHYPSLIEYDGPILEGFEQPQLPPDFAKLDPARKTAARKLHTAQSIWGLYQIFTQKQAPGLLRTLRYRDTLQCQLLSLAGSIFDDGEAYVQSLLSELASPTTWNQVVGAKTPCPLFYSDDERQQQQGRLAQWEKDVERKARVIEEVGAYTGWDGAVSPEEFDVVSQRLQAAKEDFLQRESHSGSLDERRQWESVWPFQDGQGKLET